MISRRAWLAGSLAAASVFPCFATDAPEAALRAKLGDLERRYGGRLGVAIFDTARRRLISHRGDERFALCSTHKLLSVAFVLARCDRREESLDRVIVHGRDKLMAYSPVTQNHVGAGMTVAALCEAALTLSDNTAANLLLESFGGPPALTSHLRWLGDRVTRLDRNEPALNSATPGDPRDTTTPVAMCGSMEKIVLGSALSATSRVQLIAWLVACKTGDKRLRAGIPKQWRVGDKTGSGDHNATNDVAVLWPPQRAPIIVTAYYVESRASADQREAVLAEVGRLAAVV